jgi:hypothetical protein
MLVNINDLQVVSVSTKLAEPDSKGVATSFLSLKVLTSGYLKTFWGFANDFTVLPVEGEKINASVWISAKVSSRDGKAYLTFQVKSIDIK